MKLWFSITATWVLMLGATSRFDREIRASLWVGVMGWWFLLDLVGVVLVAVAIGNALRSVQTRRVRWAGAALVLVGVVGAWHATSDCWVRMARFHLLRPGYEARIAQIQTRLPVASGGWAGQDCRIEPGPPLRVAFVQPGGVLDNFTAIVYDPTGAVLRVNAIRTNPALRDDPKLTSVRLLFGGDLVYAEALGGAWYWCGFS